MAYTLWLPGKYDHNDHGCGQSVDERPQATYIGRSRDCSRGKRDCAAHLGKISRRSGKSIIERLLGDLMSDSSLLLSIAILGGTGKEGKGRAYRWAKAGYHIHIGSRDSAKAQTAANETMQFLGWESINDGFS